MDGLSKEVCKRLPLAEAVLRMLWFVCDEDFLEEAFERHRGRSYQRNLSFALMVQLVADALIKHDGSGLKSFEAADEAEVLPTTIRAVYRKLARLPLSLSIGFLRESTARLRELFPESMLNWSVPESVGHFEVVIHDGKKIKHVAKRLGATRGTLGQIIGGKLVVSQSLNTGMALVVSADRDGERADQPLVPSALAQLRSVVATPILNVADRMFCDLVQVSLFRESGDHFLLRWHKKVTFHRDDEWQTIAGTDRYGRSYEEDWGWIGGPSDERRCYVRRIQLKQGDVDLTLVTDLTDQEAFPADDLLEVYLSRWGIELMFQKVTDVFHLKKLIGSTPEATIFQAAFCFLIYNMLEVMRCWIADGQSMEPNEVSLAKVFDDVREELIAWNKMLDLECTIDLLESTWTSPQVNRRLKQLLHGRWSKRWKKAPSNTHVNPPPDRKYLEGGHSSVARLAKSHKP